MGYVARGLYRELLDEQWVKGGIPSDMQQLADICDCPLEVMQVEWPKMARCFSIKKKGLLMNGTLESMRTEMDTRRTKLAGYGKVGGVTKLNGDNADEAKAKPELTADKPKLSLGHIGEKRREENIKPSRSPLEDIYLAYPKHVAKKAAIEAIGKALKKSCRSAEWMLERVEAYATTRKGQDEQFTPYPATWFNEGRYEDEGLAPKPKPLWTHPDGTPFLAGVTNDPRTAN
jgi:hypothetical protein